MGLWPKVTPNNYISETNAQTLNATSGIDYVLKTTGQVLCSVAGLVFISQLPDIRARIADTDYILNGKGIASCDYLEFCPNGNTHASCGTGTDEFLGNPNDCKQYLHTHDLVVNDVCLFVGVAEFANFAIDCN